mmetsp:Transcript_33158/g.66500  ORF Transcript_33158/g.66500 Transcript_33158/m.66500 type:complete len:104 (-) Transcript_33158:31-342(-)|eukprot:CAMPEP_0202854622 /NCGR_PEP_ID=MMETSP1389-20130828/91096_1 /ASSEMBLY_ACC=CAM_ASM_000865 /TAXON_ID=302021 /ORGANISM="Rhodomonas sp., Strain CCMP768" /LENGTH=103 /DNA_ID=CAMNT_0049533217 /DNA_START=633 /DNA_END=944 /DNA_ORIENTATION=-
MAALEDSSAEPVAPPEATVMQHLMECNGNPNCLNLDGNTPLHFAAFNGSAESAGALLALNAMIFVDPSNRSGITPLGVAVENGRQSVVDMLISAGAKHMRMLI